MSIIHETPAEAMRRLEELGVSLEALHRAMMSGINGRLSATPNDAPFIPGTLGWGMTLRGLREGLGPLGWINSDPGNFSIVTNVARRLNIVVESGDAATCNPRIKPRTKAQKGLYVEAVALRNRIEGDLFPETISEDLRRVAVALQHPTWVLLIFLTDSECRAELSLPNDVEKEHITDWAERIFIPAPPDSPFSKVEAEPIVPTSPIDIPVRRRAS